MSDPNLLDNSANNAWELSKENIQPLRGGRRAAVVTGGAGAASSSSSSSSGGVLGLLQQPSLSSSSLLMSLGPNAEQLKAIKDTKSSFEAELRVSSSLADPLDPWHRYIVWVEQTFPKGGKEGKLNVLLENCIKEFKDDERCNQDQRYLDVWMKYADMSQTPLEMYQFMYTHNLCTKLSGLYVNWAWELEQIGNFKKAEHVFLNALEKLESVEDKEVVQRKRELFQARVMKKLLDAAKSEDDDEPAEEERAVLGALKGQGKKQKVGSVRVGDAKKADGPGVLPTSSNPANQGPRMNASKPVFGIYQDENSSTFSDPCLPTLATEAPRDQNLPFRHQTNRENELTAGKWSQARIGKKSHAVPLDQISARPSFEIHKDEAAASKEQNLITPHKLDFATSGVLHSRKAGDERDTPLALFEPPDPNVRPMYCKHLVYQGTTEFSFEELRAIKVRKRVEEKAMEEKMAEMKRMATEVEERTEALRREQEQFRIMQEKMLQEQQERMAQMQKDQEEALRRMQEEFFRRAAETAAINQKPSNAEMENKDRDVKQSSPAFMTNHISEPSCVDDAMASATASTCKPPLPSAFTIYSDDSITASSNGGGSTDVSGRKSSLLEDTAMLLQLNTRGTSRHATDNLQKSPARAIAPPSPTVNTLEAINLVQKMWGKPEEAEEEDKGLSRKNAPQFQIFCDTAAIKKPPTTQPFPVFTDENAVSKPKATFKAPFPIFQDNVNKENKPVTKGRPRLLVEECKQIDGDDDDDDDERKENMPPSDYQQIYLDPSRQVAGILQPSQSVPFVPLDVQEAILDEDEDSQNNQEMSSFEKMPPPSGLPVQPQFQQQQQQPSRNPNMTIALPSMEAFEEMAEKMSTPFSGRRYCPKDDDYDENTCAVEIFTKRQVVEKQQEQQQPSQEPQGVDVKSPEQQLQDDAQVPPLILSPIMETSREHNYRSSSSSGHSTCHQLMKSHWGNTQLSSGTTLGHDAKTPGGASMLLAKGVRTSEMTYSSGYMADSSSARTPGMFLLSEKKSNVDGNQELLIRSPCVSEKRQKMSESFADDKEVEEEEEEEDEMTGCYKDMMSKFQKDCKKAVAAQQQSSAMASHLKMPLVSAAASFTRDRSAAPIKPSFLEPAASTRASFLGQHPIAAADGSIVKSSFLQESLKESYSFLERSEMPNHSQFSTTAKSPFVHPDHHLHTKSFASPKMDATSSFLSPKMDATSSFMCPRDVSPVMECSAAVAGTPEFDVTRPDYRAESPRNDVSECVAQLSLQSLEDISDPFEEALQMLLLGKLATPVSRRHGYIRVSTNLPQVRSNREVMIGPSSFLIGQCKGEGAYGKVFKAMRKEGSNLNETIADMDVVLKIQKPACEWEFYICTEIHERLGRDSAYHEWFMSIPRCFTYDDGSIFVSEHHQGTLLDVINNVMTSMPKSQHEAVAMYFVIEMLIIAERLKEMDMIHGDIKPDNFLIQSMPRLNLRSQKPFEDFSPSLQLIDFGRSIDLRILPRGTTFSHCFGKEDLRTPEMLEGKAWTYQLDYFGIASTAYVLLAGTYMDMAKNPAGQYFPKGSFKRWWNHSLWTDFYTEFLNIPSCDQLPDLAKWRERFENIFCQDKRNTFSDIVSAMFSGR